MCAGASADLALLFEPRPAQLRDCRRPREPRRCSCRPRRLVHVARDRGVASGDRLGLRPAVHNAPVPRVVDVPRPPDPFSVRVDRPAAVGVLASHRHRAVYVDGALARRLPGHLDSPVEPVCVATGSNAGSNAGIAAFEPGIFPQVDDLIGEPQPTTADARTPLAVLVEQGLNPVKWWELVDLL